MPITKFTLACMFLYFFLIVISGCASSGMPREIVDETANPQKWQMLHSLNLNAKQSIPEGPSIIKVENPICDLVLVYFESGNCSGWFFVEKGQSRQYQVQNGEYAMYFVYNNEPDALYQGDEVVVDNQISTIILQPSLGGNYNMRKIK
jgi:hypothetical protein